MTNDVNKKHLVLIGIIFLLLAVWGGRSCEKSVQNRFRKYVHAKTNKIKQDVRDDSRIKVFCFDYKKSEENSYYASHKGRIDISR